MIGNEVSTRPRLLTEKQWQTIRKLKNEIPKSVLAERYGVGVATIRRIQQGWGAPARRNNRQLTAALNDKDMEGWTDDQRRYRATHIAGHAVVDLHFGIPFTCGPITVSGYRCTYESSPLKTISEIEIFTLARFAGHAAEHVLLGRDMHVQGLDWGAVHDSVEPLFPTEFAFDCFIDRLLKKSVTLVKRKRIEIERAAELVLMDLPVTDNRVRRISQAAVRARCLVVRRTKT